MRNFITNLTCRVYFGDPVYHNNNVKRVRNVSGLQLLPADGDVAWFTVKKQGEDMVKSSNNGFNLLEDGTNVKIPNHSIDRPPIGPTSLVGMYLMSPRQGTPFNRYTTR